MTSAPHTPNDGEQLVRIELEGVSRHFTQTPAVDDVSLNIEPGELVALLGPSGSGKTTLLRLIAGLDFPDAGEVRFDGDDVSRVHLRHRRVGFVFQHYALFRNMRVADNIAFGLRVRARRQRPDAAAIRRRVDELLDLVHLGGLQDRFPSELSGGQRQRVALARALAIDPRVLLLDEPFGALDAKVRKELRRWLRELHEETGRTTVFVTHDQDEAMELADRVVVMHEGAIEQVGTPAEIHDNPQSAFVCSFIGEVNRFEGTLQNGELTVCGERFPVEGPAGAEPSGRAVAYVRSHDFELTSAASGKGALATVRGLRPFGATVRLELALSEDHARIDAEVPREIYDAGELQIGQTVRVRPGDARVFASESASTGETGT